MIYIVALLTQGTIIKNEFIISVYLIKSYLKRCNLYKQTCKTENKVTLCHGLKSKTKKLLYSEKEPKEAADQVICPDRSTFDPD